VLLAALLALAPTALAADCGPPTFTFVGQPGCIALVFDGQHTQLHNGCGSAVLVDVSVLSGAGGSPAIPPGADAELRDLSAFTLGMDGEIHRAVALVEPAACPEPEPAPAPAPEPSLFQAVLAVVMPG
jgi:hypothetical protein